jgi:hypothetical protein
VAHYLPVDRGLELSAAGKARALCGRIFLPAPLTAPLGRPCPLCETVLEPAAAHPTSTARTGARRG